MNTFRTKTPRLQLAPDAYEQLRQRVLKRDNWRCQNCGSMRDLEVHHKTLRSQSGDDSELNLITLCNSCHANEHC
jgi:5-methylcytosine-specific restriction endonuclease McrA